MRAHHQAVFGSLLSCFIAFFVIMAIILFIIEFKRATSKAEKSSIIARISIIIVIITISIFTAYGIIPTIIFLILAFFVLFYLL